MANGRNNKGGKAEASPQKDLRQELAGALFLALTLVFVFSLASYSPTDPSLDSAATDETRIHNLLGIVGSHLAGIMIHLFGLSAFWFPIILFMAAVSVFTRSNPRHPVLLGGGGLVLLLGTAGTFALGPRELTLFGAEFSSGGILGLFIKSSLEHYTGGFGAAFILISSLVAGMLICTNLSLMSLFKVVWLSVTTVGRGVALGFEKRKARKEKAKVRQEHEKKIGRKEAVIVDPPPPPPVTIKEPEETTYKQQAFDFVPTPGNYEPPSLNLLEDPPPRETTVQRESLIMNSRLLEKKLLDFGVEGSVTEVAPGPVITMYEYEPAPGVKISKVSGLSDDLALALRAHSIRIVAPIPGKAAIGVEIPNTRREVVYLKEILCSEAFSAHSSHLVMALGKDTSGLPVVTDLAKMPHLLIAGATGSGKSVGLNAMILSILYKSSPDDVRFLLIDPKRIELSTYEGIPHLLHPVLSDPKQATLGLRWTVEEMERRYRLLAKMGARNISSYNQKLKKMAKKAGEPPAEGQEPEEEPRELPYIVVVIDELADLMMVSSKEVETHIARLAQMARAAGIHLILATQRPSVDVLTGVIKANFPVRISFQVSSRIDSRTILDNMGAEKLLGNGDMLFLPPGVSKVQRIHGAYVSEPEVAAVAGFLRDLGEVHYEESILNMAEEEDKDVGEEEYDAKYDEAVQLVTETGQASISMIQRRLRVGYNRAARMIEIMEKEGVVGPSDGVKPRQVLVNRL